MMFGDYYEFNFRTDKFYVVEDIAPVEENREQKHEDIEEGIATYTSNWEHIATDTERRRGSDRLYLVDDEHYIWSSRTGFEQRANVIQFSESSPDALQFAVLSTVFETILRKRFQCIKEEGETVTVGSLTVSGLKTFLIEQGFSDEEKQEYYDRLGDIIIELVSRFNKSTTVHDLKEAVTWYRETEKELYRELSGFEPTMISNVMKTLEIEDGWHGPDPNKIDGAERLFILLSIDYHIDGSVLEQFVIEVNETNASLIHERGREDTFIETIEYETPDECRTALQTLMSHPKYTG